MTGIDFGLGLIGIGKPWGHTDPTVPSEADSLRLLERAFSLGVRYYDTAPSYGFSEERLGKFLDSLAPSERAQVRIATKFGEHWNFERAEPFVDHSFEALRKSLDLSLARLKRIDLLQLHKTSPDVLRSGDLPRAWEYAEKMGVADLGASVSDSESAEIVLQSETYSALQFPFNYESRKFEPLMQACIGRGLRVIVNRPFAMGKMFYEGPELSKVEAFRFILERRFSGVILSGTKSATHLEENWKAFHQALATIAMRS